MLGLKSIQNGPHLKTYASINHNSDNTRNRQTYEPVSRLKTSISGQHIFRCYEVLLMVNIYPTMHQKIFHNVTIWWRKCAHIYKMVCCGICEWYIVRFVQQFYRFLLFSLKYNKPSFKRLMVQSIDGIMYHNTKSWYRQTTWANHT